MLPQPSEIGVQAVLRSLASYSCFRVVLVTETPLGWVLVVAGMSAAYCQILGDAIACQSCSFSFWGQLLSCCILNCGFPAWRGFLFSRGVSEENPEMKAPCLCFRKIANESGETPEMIPEKRHPSFFFFFRFN